MKTIIISLISVFVGWFLGQGSELLKTFVYNIKLKKSLLLELQDLKEELIRTSVILERKIQIYALKGIEPSIPLEISHYFFQHYYKDIFNLLNREQRLSFQIIHSHINSLNDNFKKLGDVTLKCYELTLKKEMLDNKINPVDKWGDYIIADYKNVREILWHIEFHLSNPKKPNLSLFSKTHNEYIRFEKDLDENVKKIVSQAKNLNRKDFQ